MTPGLAQAGCVAGALGLLALMVGTGRPARLAGFACWAAGVGTLAWYLAPGGHRGLLAGAAAAALVLAGALAVLLVRWPWLLPFLVLAALPVRLSVHVGETRAHLLLPLYLVVAATALALFWQLPVERPRTHELGPLGLPLGLLVGWLGLSALWTDDLRRAAIELLCFVLPFGLLAVALARVPWNRRWVGALAAELALMGLLFALVGLVQWLTRDVTWSPPRIYPGAHVAAFRADSVFLDPAPYARFLVLALLATLVVAATARPGPRAAAGLAATVAVTWAGLAVADSPAALAALAVGALAVGALLWRRVAVLAAVLVLAASLGAAAAVPQSRHALADAASSRWDEATSGRTARVAEEGRIALDHPLAGVGLGGLDRAYRARTRPEERPQDPWRSTPVAVAAESGAVGLLLLAWVAAEALLGAFRRRGAAFAARAAAGFGIMVAAIVVHSLFVDTLLEDVAFWALLALAVSARRVREPAA